MLMRKPVLLALAASLLFLLSLREGHAQSDTSKFEVGIHFTSLTKPDIEEYRTEPGIGGRFTYNLTDYLGLEAEGDLFPNKCTTCTGENRGRITEALFGVKAGKRFRRFGLFGKGRPGLVSFSNGRFVETVLPGPIPTFALITQGGVTNFAFDIGGVLEVYPSRRMLVRFDSGSTIIRYGSQRTSAVSGRIRAEVITDKHTTGNFQFSAGIGFRF